MDVGATNGWRMDDVVPAAEIVAAVDAAFPLEPADAAYRGEVAKRWRYVDGKGEIGVIASVTQPFCGDCTRSRISAEGKLYTCLFAVRGHDLRALIRGGATDEELSATARRDLARPRRPLLRAPLRGRRRPRRRSARRDVATSAAEPAATQRRLAATESGCPVMSAGAGCKLTVCRRWLQQGGASCRADGRISGARWRSGSASRCAYQVARGLTDRHPAKAFANGFRVVDFETRLTHRLYELTFQQFVDQRHWLAELVSWTYWNSEFTVVGLALLWVYIRRHEQLLPLPQLDPARERARAARLRLHADGAAAAARRRLRQHPHRRARPARRQPVRGDAEPARLRLADRRRRPGGVTRHWWAKVFWVVWPAWVWFAVMATGNHFWLDCLAGMVRRARSR